MVIYAEYPGFCLVILALTSCGHEKEMVVIVSCSKSRSKDTVVAHADIFLPADRLEVYVGT